MDEKPEGKQAIQFLVQKPQEGTRDPKQQG